MTAIFCAISLRRACEVKQYSRIAETGSAERRCPSAGDDLPALMMADRERGENMTNTNLLRKKIDESGYKLRFVASKLGITYQGFL